MDRNLPKALDLVFGHEGGYVNRASDRGGPTKYGITIATLRAWRGRSVTAADVKALGSDEAEDIYRKGYWAQSGGPLLPDGLDYAVFDFGVNSGPARAVRYLQKVVGVKRDGSIGPVTMDAVRQYEGGVVKLIADYCDARMEFLRGIRDKKTGFPANGRGWTIRVTGVDPDGEWPDTLGVVGNALRMARGASPRTTHPRAAETAKAEPKERNKWLSPERLGQLLPGAGGLSVLASGEGPVQWAIGAVLVIGALLAVWFIVRREHDA
jgi:lysozyme family protein